MSITLEGITVATDEVGGAHYQQTKLAFGGTGVATPLANVDGSRLPVEFGDDNPVTLQASQVSGITNTTTTRTTTTGLGRYTDLDILIKFTAGGAATGTLQIFIQDSADGGTTFDDLVSSNTFTFGAAATSQRFTISGRVASTRAQGIAPVTETLSAGSAHQGPWGDRLRIREKVSGVSGSPTGVTYTIIAIAKR